MDPSEEDRSAAEAGGEVPDGWRACRDTLWRLLDTVVREERPEVPWALIDRLDQPAPEGSTRVEAGAVNRGGTIEAAWSQPVARYWTERLRLQNLAEDLYRLDRVQARRRKGQTWPRGAIDRLAARLSQEPPVAPPPSLTGRLVLTSHPTESTRQTVLQTVRRLADLWRDRPAGSIATTVWEARLRETVRALWRTPALRAQRPRVEDEVERGLYYLRATLFATLPEVEAHVEAAVAPRGLSAPVWRIDSWIGGDRDGHPGVTTAVTRQTLIRHHQTAQALYLQTLDELTQTLTAGRDDLGDPAGAVAWVEALGQRDPVTAAAVQQRYPQEPLRQAVGLIRARLAHTPMDDLFAPPSPDGYANADALAADLDQVATYWDTDPTHHPPVLQRLRRQLRLFGWHLMALDIRQHSRVHRAALREVVGAAAVQSDAEALRVLTHTWDQPRAWIAAEPETRDLQATLALIGRYQARWGDKGLPHYLVSMTHGAVDLVAVLYLLHQVSPTASVDIVPVFETLDDLTRAPEVLEAAWQVPAWRHHVEQRGCFLEVMLGYSDSTKDAGAFTAAWAIDQAQIALAQWGNARGCQVGFFHGRGGALGRGGGPTSAAILGQPPEVRAHPLRITQQGEVLSQKFLWPPMAWRSLELVMTAHLTAAWYPTPAPDAAARGLMDTMAATAHRTYRALVDHPGFWPYFLAVTPIREMTALNWGSRPAWRETFRWEDLRAIPWVFAWTQIRLLLPGWYGAGTALQEAVADRGHRERLRAWYRDWPYWTTLVHNLELALIKTRLPVAEHYQALASPVVRAPFWPRIQEEYQQLGDALRCITDHTEPLADHPALAAAIAQRQSLVDPLNRLQIAALQQYRADPSPAGLQVIAQTMEGIALGLRNTG